MKKIAAVVVSLALSVLLILLVSEVRSCQRAEMITDTLMMGIGHGYQDYMREEGSGLEFDSPQEFISKLRGNNPRGRRYVYVSPSFLSHEGLVLDEWERPLQFESHGKNRVLIRSAGWDGRFGTWDDLVSIFPQVAPDEAR